jgi:hypothetical protein
MALSIGGGISVEGGITISPNSIGPPAPALSFNTPAIMNASSFESILAIDCAAINTSGLITVIGQNSGNFASAISSNNGVSWTGPTVAISGSTFLSMMTWSSFHNLFLAMGVNASSLPIYSTSTDGINWTTPVVLSSTPIGSMYSITVSSAGVFVAIMIPNPGGLASFSTSTDGSTWTTPTTIPGAGTSGIYFFGAAITVNSSGKFIVTGYNVNDNTPWYSVSTDGSTWTSQQMFNSIFQPRAVEWSSYHNLFVTVGTLTGGILGYSTSNNGTTWTTPTAISGAVNSMQIFSLAVDPNGLFVGVGQWNNGGTTSPLYMTSTDGINWCTPLLFNSSSAQGFMRGIVYSTASSSFVAVGFGRPGPTNEWIYSYSV